MCEGAEERPSLSMLCQPQGTYLHPGGVLLPFLEENPGLGRGEGPETLFASPGS